MVNETPRTRSALGLTIVGTIAIVAIVAALTMRSHLASVGNAPATVDSPVSAASMKPAAAALRLERSQDPESDAMLALGEEFGFKCFSGSDILFQFKPGALEGYDRTIADKKLESGWVKEGSVYAGDALAAAAAFGATRAFGDDGSIWIVQPGAEPMALELRRTETPAKNTVWLPMNRVTRCVEHQ